MDDAKNVWDEGLKEEVDFWREVLSGKKQVEFCDQMRARANPDALLQPAFLELLPHRPISDVKILDVAAGPISWCGWTKDEERVSITAIDALADVYNELLDEYNFFPPIRTTKGEAENLVAQFGVNQFDIVHILNALDHCYDPLKAVQEMLLVAKPDGVVFIQGNINEAEAANYDGLHQWNIDVRDEKLVFWNKEETIFVNERFSNTNIIANLWRNDRWMNAYLRKDI